MGIFITAESGVLTVRCFHFAFGDCAPLRPAARCGEDPILFFYLVDFRPVPADTHVHLEGDIE